MSFETAVAKLLVLEGGYVNNSSDPGGETNFGITKRTYPDLDIASLTKAQASDIYRQDFWLKGGLDKLPDLSASKMLDMSVNMGPFHAVKLLQGAVCRLGTGVVVDGKMGPATQAACQKMDDKKLLVELRLAQANYYRTLAAEHPQLRVFLNGWLRRAAT